MTDSPRTAHRSRGRIPLDQRSVLATERGVPWWGALACAVAAALVGFLIDSARGDDLTRVFSILYFLGCVAAVLIVRNKSLYTAMVQPPLILAAAVPLAYRSFADGPSQGIKGIVFDMALPLIQRFPTMIVTTVVVCIIGAFRATLYIQARRAASGGAGNARKSPSPRGGSTHSRRAPARAGAAVGAGTSASPAAEAPGARAPRAAESGSRRAGGRTRVRGTAADAAPPRPARSRRTAARDTAPRGGVAQDRAPRAAMPAAPVSEPAPRLPNVRYRGE